MDLRLSVLKGLVLVVVSMVAMSAQAGIYQWTDEQGRIHFTDKAPKQTQVKDISSDVSRSNIDESHRLRKGLSELFAPMTEVEKRWHKEQQRRQLVQLQQNCREQKELLVVLQSTVNLTENGQSLEVSERERQQRQHKQQQKVERMGC